MAGKRKKHKTSLTGILAGLVVVFLIALVLLVTGYRRTGSGRQNDSAPETEESSEAIQNVADEEESQADSEKTRMEPETVQSDSKEADTESEPESERIIVLGEEEAETEMEVETEAKTEAETDRETENAETEKLVVAIDPGHQGSWVDMSDTEPLGPGSSEMKTKSSTGTQGSYSGLAEYELNLEISLQLRTELEERGYEVVLTREDNDTAISNAERAIYACEQGGDIYVRIHANGSENSSIQGALAMVPSSSNPYVGDLAEDSYLLAECILSAYCSTAGFDSLGVQYYDNMTGINWSKIPVMILEMGFMTNESDDLRMADASVQALMVEGIADGIDDYFIRKGLKTERTEDTAETDELSSEALDLAVPSAESTELMNSLLEVLGEGYLYPSSDQGETWSLCLKSLDEGTEGDINGDFRMKSASVMKVFIMAAVYDRVYYPSSEERRISVEELYSGELDELIAQMITVSDNDAANTLVKLLGGGEAQAGIAVVNQFLEENGYTGTTMGRLFLEENPAGDNFTTAIDCAVLLESIYSGACVGEDASAAMYEYLKQQKKVSKIPAGLTDTGALVANKTGELAGDYGDYVENDIAIVDTGDQVYVLCVLSENLRDNSAAAAQIAEISKLVYDTLSGGL